MSMRNMITLPFLLLPFIFLGQSRSNKLKLNFHQKRIQHLYKKQKYERCITIGRNRNLSRENIDRVTYYYLALSYFRLYDNKKKGYLFDRSIRYLSYSNFNSNKLVNEIANHDTVLLNYIHEHLISLAKKESRFKLDKTKSKLKYANYIFNDSTDYLSVWLPPSPKPNVSKKITKKEKKKYLNIAQEIEDLFLNGYFSSSSLSVYMKSKLNIHLNELQSNMLDKVAGFYGMSETAGKNHNQNVVNLFHDLGYKNINDDETPWCAAFINYCAKQIGAKYPSGLRAKSWLSIGKLTNYPSPGDVIVFWRNSQKSSAGHVGLFISEDENYVYCLGGNQSDKVQISPFPKERILQYRKLTKK